jgi:hypothetical protein
VALGALLLPSSVAHSQSQNSSSGIADDALPGVMRVDSAAPIPKGIGLAMASGYGYTGAELDDSDTHHRGSGRLAAAYRIIPDLAVVLRFDGRYDKHSGEVGGSDDGWVGDPRLIGRFRKSISDSLSAGVQVGFWAPSSDVPSIDFDALSIEGVGALTYTNPAGTMAVSFNAGYRLDRSDASVEEPERLSLADRLSLGLSEFNALLVGLGTSYKIGEAEILAEWGLDLLQGAGKPAFSQSPMRIGLGARMPLTDAVELFGTGEFRLSKVDSAEIMTSLLPFEPKFQALFGMNLRFGADKPVVEKIIVDDTKKEPTPEPDPTVAFKGVINSGGAPVPNASLVIRDKDGKEKTTQTGADGSFVLEDVLVGTVTVTVSADGFEDKTQTVNLAEGVPDLDLALEAVLPPGQLRGLVRSFRGKPLTATLTVMPVNETLQTAADGTFELDLPPGDYDVTVVVPGYTDQTRQIHIDDGGVTIMNVDLRK